MEAVALICYRRRESRPEQMVRESAGSGGQKPTIWFYFQFFCVSKFLLLPSFFFLYFAQGMKIVEDLGIDVVRWEGFLPDEV